MGLPAAEQAEKSGQLYELRAGSSPHAYMSFSLAAAAAAQTAKPVTDSNYLLQTKFLFRKAMPCQQISQLSSYRGAS